MTDRTEKIVSGLVALSISVAYLVWSYTYVGRPHTVPNLIGWCAVVLSVLDLIAHTNTAFGRSLNGLLSGQALDSAQGPVGQQAGAMKIFVACVWPVLFVALVTLIGFVAAIPIYIFSFMMIQGRLSWWSSLITAASVALVIWIVFDELMNYTIFQGILFGGQF